MKSCHICFFYFTLMMLTIIVFCSRGELSGTSNKFLHSFHQDKNESTVYANNRKLLVHGSCTNRDISISQSKDSTSGIPQYVVQIVNTCVSGCAPSDIHLHCGWFASARIVNPKTFKRLSYDDCLVNGGTPLRTSQMIRFTYSNSFMYPIVFKSAKFC
ncbi:protein TAPETUM DETERMINANT 1-like [Melia azedarach]|uniref:Protein TAPETUM DETERMINANT 1-like n=1 Tax=Melia azedarach TaxID=155640 RepID=A0ACC1YED2_MELAZ|nr:protein TAPETUM DETERMINANT 1-like [Melia azedarach]